MYKILKASFKWVPDLGTSLKINENLRKMIPEGWELLEAPCSPNSFAGGVLAACLRNGWKVCGGVGGHAAAQKCCKLHIEVALGLPKCR